jgi:hypothetical protein
MRSLESLLRPLVYGTTLVILIIVIGALLNEKPSSPISEPIAEETVPAASLIPDKVIPTEPREVKQPVKQERVATPDRLIRFDVLRKKALLNDEESAERERLLSNLKTVQWIESQLTSASNDSHDIKERLNMIDFLEDVVTWSENPIRSDALGSIVRVLQTNNFDSLSAEERKTSVGDKIELFVILAQQEPDKARLFLEKTTDPKIREIIQYAIKRLALQKKVGE